VNYFNTFIYSGEYEPGAAGGQIVRCRRSQPAAASTSLKKPVLGICDILVRISIRLLSSVTFRIQKN
jgi:hypothetical protein